MEAILNQILEELKTIKSNLDPEIRQVKLEYWREKMLRERNARLREDGELVAKKDVIREFMKNIEREFRPGGSLYGK